ncbi:hypothetical protein FF1_025751 [Malus domestica]
MAGGISSLWTNSHTFIPVMDGFSISHGVPSIATDSGYEVAVLEVFLDGLNGPAPTRWWSWGSRSSAETLVLPLLGLVVDFTIFSK